MLMPSHAKNVILYKDPQPIFTRYGIESQLDAMFTPTVQLRSGGYIVLNQTEALVAIDVNSGRATREHHIEDTALKTNLEAAEEVARQLRLRDLAGLIVIDFIDMDESRNNRLVERRMKESLKHDRARIQVGRISHFGLLEMSRQRIRSSVLESSTDKCPHCGGSGHVRSVSSVTLHLLRMLEEMLLKGATHNLIVRTRTEVALYVLNQKRAHLRELESRFQITITISADASVGAAQPFLIEKGELMHSVEAAKAIAAQQPAIVPAVEEDEEIVEDEIDEETESEDHSESEDHAEDDSAGEAEASPEPVAAGASEDETQRRGRRRRRGRGRGPREGGEPREAGAEHPIAPEVGHDNGPDSGQHGEDAGDDAGQPAEARPDGRPGATDAEGRRRRRGRRGGRRNRRGREGEAPYAGADAAHEPVEPDVASAVADLGAAPVEPPREPTYESAPPSREQTSFPSAAEPLAAREPAAPPVELPAEPSRRRSTVREPAPMFSSGAMSDVQEPPAPPPAPEPAASIPEPAAATPEATPEAKPRRFGWWNKRS
jgi:ribonuclease E